MRNLMLLMHVSLDGFVAGPNGEMDWIKFDDQLFNDVGKITDEADAAMYGRVTFEMMEAYWPTAADQPNATPHDIKHSDWYKNVTKYVISRSVPERSTANTVIVGFDVANEIKKIKSAPGKNILMIGSPRTAHGFMQYGLIDAFYLYVNPVILGQGIPLFPKFDARIPLTLQDTMNYNCGVVRLLYELQP